LFALALLAIVGNFALTTIALNPAHGHPARHCASCSAASLPTLPGAAPLALPAPSSDVFRAAFAVPSRLAGNLLRTHDLRGPPSCG
jgi:hypothetical protein